MSCGWMLSINPEYMKGYTWCNATQPPVSSRRREGAQGRGAIENLPVDNVDIGEMTQKTQISRRAGPAFIESS